MSVKKITLLLVLIIIPTLAFKLPAVLNTKSFWFDEIVSLKIAELSITDSWQFLKWENNPPAHYWMLHSWIKVFGSSEIAVRLSSVLFSILSVIAIFFLGKKLFNSRVGLLASFLMAISSFQLYLSMDGRMYQMILFFAILSCYFFWQALEKPTKLNWFLYIIFSTLTLYTHLIGLFLIVSEGLYYLYRRFLLKNTRPKLSHALASNLVIILLFSPWLLGFIKRSLSVLNSGAWYLNTEANGFLLLQVPKAFLLIGPDIPLIELASILLFSSLLFAAVAKVTAISLRKYNIKFNFSPQVVFLLSIFLAPILFGFLIQLWVAKYYIFSSIGLYLLLSLGIYNLNLNKKKIILVLVIIFLLLLPYNINIALTQGQHQWHAVANYVETSSEPDDQIIIPAFVYQLPFEHYYKGDLEVVGYGPDWLDDNLLLNTVKYNWYPILEKDNMPDLSLITENKKRVIVVNSSVSEIIHNSNLVLDWFVENNWPVVEKKQLYGFIRPTIYIFQNPNYTQVD